MKERPPVRVPGFSAELPISAKREEIARAIRDHQVVIICGETGSGKTTQIPKICLAMGRGTRGMIGHTQPRRIAARSVAARIAEELQSPLGTHIGYKIRFTDTLGPQASVKIMTDGILLAETRRDPLLKAYDTLIIDEAHERSLNIDFLLGYLKRILPKRPDLKVIVTSATIDPRKFSDHFGGETCAPILEVSGRMFPVEVRYRPLVSGDPEIDDRDLRQGVLDAVDEALSLPDVGDVLVFLSGEREIREMTKALGKYSEQHVEVLPLYARLTTDEQNRIFAPHRRRRIVLATNVAETSLTVPGIRCVIDSGRARISRYSARSGVQRLPIESISRASADQRKGRCGRLGPGVCIRLYSEDEFNAREEFTPPEILRTNLASVILQMKALRLGRIEDYPFVEPPRWGMITDGYSTLHELGAIDEWGEITRSGEELARLPIDPRLGRMILAARDEGCVNEVLVIAAALSIQDPRERPHDRCEAAYAAHRQFRDENSDFITLLNLWRFFQDNSRELSQNRLRRLCRETFLSYVRMREWVDVHHQLRDLIAEAEVVAHRKGARNRKRQSGDDFDSFHRSILSGLLSRIGIKGDAYEYTGAHGRKFHIFPGSGLFRKPPQWIMAAELVETTKTYAHTVARISPKWIERIASHLVKRTYAEPHWRERTADVAALESLTLFGLEIVRNRRVPYGPIDPKASHETFIRGALVEGRYRTNAAFFRHNRALIDEIRAIEDKKRKRSVMIDDERLFSFYEARIPKDIYSGRLFEAWRNNAEKDDPRLLYLTREALFAEPEHGVTAQRFPEHLAFNDTRLPLAYRFEPGHEDDGVTVTVPRAVLHQLVPARLEWLVPGLLEEKIAALIKSLPKSIRRNFTPTAEYASACAQRMPFGIGSLTDAVGEMLHRMTGVEAPRDAWRVDAVPAYLRMNVRVVDDAGETVAKGRDVAALRRSLAEQGEGGIADGRSRQAACDVLPSGRFRRWDFGEIPASIGVKRAGIDTTAYPAIVDDGDAVVIRPMETAAQARREMRKGLRRLIMLEHPEEMRELIRQAPHIDRMAIDYAGLGFGSSDELKCEMLAAIVDHAFLDEQAETIRTKAALESMIAHGWHRTATATDAVTHAVEKSLSGAMIVRTMLADLTAPRPREAADEISDHVDRLLHPRFISTTPMSRLVHFPRYLEGDRMRIAKVTSGKLDRDRRIAAEFEPLWRRYLDRAEVLSRHNMTEPILDEHRWMLEELRIALFAQELGTVIRVSPKRIEEHWQEVAAHDKMNC